MAGSAAGKFDVEFAEELGHLVIDILAAVVGVEAENGERERVEHLPDDRQQVRFGNGLYAGDHFPLGDAVHGVDVIQPFAAIQIALVHGVDTDEAGTTVGYGPANVTRLRRFAIGLLKTLQKPRQQASPGRRRPTPRRSARV